MKKGSRYLAGISSNDPFDPFFPPRTLAKQADDDSHLPIPALPCNYLTGTPQMAALPVTHFFPFGP
jgi:hypothetical protein